MGLGQNFLFIFKNKNNINFLGEEVEEGMKFEFVLNIL